MISREGLVGDIGGTHARFALVAPGDAGPSISEPRTYNNRDFPSAKAAIDAYFDEVGARRPPAAVLAVAGPVSHGAMEFTNLKWELSETGLRENAGFKSARLINDFAAQALGAPRLAGKGLRRIGPDVQGLAGATLAVLGPGTGFGVGALVRDGRGSMVVATEGGHAGFSPSDEVEVEIWRWLAKRHGRVSIERILSGSGFHDLYLALAEIEGATPSFSDERQVQAAAGRGDRLACETADRFCAILGSTAGDIALGFGARGGVFITGGVAVGLVDRIAASQFRERFEAKGRFEDYMHAIPTQLILEPYVALIGAASLLDSPVRA
jgi:glucokinase